jgi:hypothetical protein
MSRRIRINPKRIGAHLPLPKRNKREALCRRIAANIGNEVDLQMALQTTPPYMRDAYLEELRPYLRFKPTSPQFLPMIVPGSLKDFDNGGGIVPEATP